MSDTTAPLLSVRDLRVSFAMDEGLVRAETDTTIDVSRVVFGLSAVKTAAADSALIRYDNVGP